MTVLSSREGLILLGIFGLAMISVVLYVTRVTTSSECFLVARRTVRAWQGSLSIAVSWIWAPAIFVCSMQAYEKGLPGIFWFTAPNILCFFLFTPLAIRIRREMPQGYSFPDYAYHRFGKNRWAHLAFMCAALGYQLSALVSNPLAGGYLLSALSGIDPSTAIVAMMLVALSYSLMSGLKASVVTDVIQMLMVLVIVCTLVPLCVWKAGGVSVVAQGLSGISGAHGNLFDPWIAFSLGIPMTLGLLSGPIVDQMFFQRAFAVRSSDVSRTFIHGGLLFGAVPILLSLLGFIAVTLVHSGQLQIDDSQIVGAHVIASLLPKAATYAFCFMAFAGLCSTLDSSLCAISSLLGVDLYRRYLHPAADERQILRFSRLAMIVSAVAGTSLALLQPKLLWVFLICGAVSSAAFFPALFAVFSKRVSARACTAGILSSLAIGFPCAVYANVSEDPYLIVLAALLSVGCGLITCTASVLWSYRATSLSELSSQRSPA